MIASNELPDMIRTTMAVQYPGGLDAAIDDGYFLDLTDMIPELAPNYLKALERMDEFDLNIRRSAVTPSGRYGGICQLMYEPQGAYGGMYVRQDWLDELGMDAPQTYERSGNHAHRLQGRNGRYRPASAVQNRLLKGTLIPSA